MYSLVLMAALTAGGDAPSWTPKCRPYPECGACYHPNCAYDGGWWYGATAWNGCRPVYVPPIPPQPWCGNNCDHPVFAPQGDYGPATPPSTEETAPTPKPTSKAGNRAKVIVDLPAGARLYVDGRPIAAAAPQRVLHTPDLKPGEAYYYDVHVEIVRDGRTLVENKRLVVHSGEEVRTTFTEPVFATSAGATAER